MRGKIKLGIGLGLATLAATVIASPAVAGASSRDSAASSSAAVATGTITSTSGAAIPGAPVDLYAWPSDAVLTALKPGQLVPTKLLTATTTNAAGKYTLMVPASTLEASAVDSGYANLEVRSGSGIWFFPYQTDSLPADPPAAATVNLGSKKSKWPCGYMSDGQPYYFSGWTLLKHDKNPSNAVVGQGYVSRQVGAKGDWVGFNYTLTGNHSQASSLGVGVSGYGLDAGYSSTGTKTSTVVRGEGYHHSAKNSWFRTEFTTAQYRGECYGIPNDPIPQKKQHGKCPKRHGESYVRMCLWSVGSTGWAGGSTQVHPSYTPPAPAKFCLKHEAGDHFDTDYGSAVEWSSGFTVGASIKIKGVNLKTDFGTTAHTGYDTNAVMDFHFGHKTFLCGTNGFESKAAILEARSHR